MTSSPPSRRTPRTPVEVRDQVASLDGSEWFRLAGVKFILDGVIDACTAAMRAP